MSEKRFSTREAISFGLGTVRNNLGLFLGVTIVIVAGNLIPGFFARYARFYPGRFLEGAFMVSALCINALMIPGMIKICLDFCDGKEGRFKDLFAQTHLFFPFLAAEILCFFLIPLLYWGIGSMLIFVLSGQYFQSNFSGGAMAVLYFLPLIVLGIFSLIVILIGLQFFICFLLDNNTKVLEFFKKSYDMIKGSWLKLFVFSFSLCFVNILGFLCLRIGLLVTIPQTFLAIAYVYRKLVAQEKLSLAPAKLIE